MRFSLSFSLSMQWFLFFHGYLHLKSLLLSGYLIGYLVHQKKDFAPNCAPSVSTLEQPVVVHETGAAPLMDWDDVKKLLAQKVSAGKFESVFR